MSDTVCKADLDAINRRLNKLPKGDFAVTSIGVKNYLMWAGGNWEPEYDYAVHEFFANCKSDVKKLIDDLNFYKQMNRNLLDAQSTQSKDIEKLKIEVHEIRNSLTDDMR